MNPLDLRTVVTIGCMTSVLCTLVILTLWRQNRKRAEEERGRLLAEREQLMAEREQAISAVKTLKGLLPICASCKKVRDDKGYWNQIESYISQHSDAEFSHSLCPDCMRALYPEFQQGDTPEK